MEAGVNMGSIGSTTQVSIWSAVSGNKISLPLFATDYNRSEIQFALDARIEEARNAGYEIIPRPYSIKGIDFTESKIEFTAKASDREKTLSKSSKLGEHYENTKNQYEDVIVLPASPILPNISRSGGRNATFKTSYSAQFVVMARRKK